MTIHKFNCEMSDRTVAFDFRLSPTDRPLRVCVSKTVYFSVNEYRIREIARSLVECTDGFTTPTPITKHRVDYSMVSFNFDYLKRLKIGRLSSIDDLNIINRFVHLVGERFTVPSVQSLNFKQKCRF